MELAGKCLNKISLSQVTSMHQSKGVHLAQSRLDLDNLLNQGNASIETIDKKDKEGKATGTMVIVNFKEY